MVRVKVCGHTRPEDVEASIAAGVDAIGVVVDVPVETPREVDGALAAELLDMVPPFVSGVLVTMQERAEDVRRLIDVIRPDVVQVHGGLSLDELHKLVRSTTIPVVVATDLASSGDIDAVADLADAVLLDSRDEQGGGGTGRTHDWQAARELRRDLDVPIILAGGLTPENVASAIETVEPFAVDVATGVEAEGGIKDHDAVEGFVRRAGASTVRVEQ